MAQPLHLYELPFTSVEDVDLINLFSDTSGYTNISFEPFPVSDDKYNSALDITRSSLSSRYLNVPSPEYISLDKLSSLTTYSNITTLLNMNIRSVPTNIQSFEDLILSSICVNIDVIGFTETRLDEDLVPLYQLPSYSMFTSCRNRYGGGVAVYISHSIKSSMLHDFSFVESYMECTSVLCTFTDKKYLYICIYRPPSGNVENFFEKLSDILAKANDNKYILYVFGDFNLDLIKQNDNQVFEFVNLMYSFSLFPLITKPTRVTSTSATILDHIWVSQPESNMCNYIISTNITDHFPVVSQSIVSERVHSTPVYKDIRILNQAALNDFHNDLSMINWHDVIKSSCPNMSYDAFHNIFESVFQKWFPLKRVRVNIKSKRSPYVTEELRGKIKERNRLERLANKWPLTYGEIYKKYRNSLTSILRRAKNDYHKNTLRESQGNPKSHWNSINSILGRNSNLTNTIRLNPHCADISGKFNEHFLDSATFNDTTGGDYLNYLHNSPPFSMYLPPVSHNEIEKYICALNTDSSGYDDIPPKVIKHSSALLTLPVTHIINLTFKTGIFPDKLKIAKVIPVHKKGDKTDVNNYRPISVLPAFSKIFEKAISNRLKNYLETNGLISKYQHGFRSNHSTESAILQFTNNIYTSLERKQYVVGVFMDLSKAFDTINHQILISKLRHIGVRGLALRLFESYITNRSQAVCCNGKYSDLRFLFAGVPQGSILGPTLFIIYINDIIHSSSKFKFTMYADDTNLLLEDSDLETLHSNLLKELDLVNYWLKSNKLKLNLAKTHYICFQNRSVNNQIPPIILEDQQLQCISHTKFLGVTIDENLNWNYHINNVYTKLSRVCGILYKVRYLLTPEALLSIYYTLCYPHLMYCVSVWGCTWPSFLKRLKVIQNNIFRCIFHLGKFDSTANVSNENKLLDVYNIHKCYVLCVIFRNIRNSPANSYFKLVRGVHETRATNGNVVCPNFRTTLFKNSIFHFGPSLWNTLPIHIKLLVNSSTFSIFKTDVKKYLTLQQPSH